jgi:hypothetical protein
VRQLGVVVERMGCPIEEIGLGGVARGILARPEVYPVRPTYIETKKPMPERDTKSHHDLIVVQCNMERDMRDTLARPDTYDDGLLPPPSAEDAIAICKGDLQSGERQGNSKARNGKRFLNFVPLDAGFHFECAAKFGYVEVCALAARAV